MSTNKDDDSMDLDSILSEINTSIKNEVTKAKLPKNQKHNTKKKQQQKKVPLGNVFAETTKIIEDAAQKTSDEEIQDILNEIHSNNDVSVAPNAPEKPDEPENPKENEPEKQPAEPEIEPAKRFIAVSSVIEENDNAPKTQQSKKDVDLLKKPTLQNINQMEKIFNEKEKSQSLNRVDFSDTKINLDEIKNQAPSPLSPQSLPKIKLPKDEPDIEVSRANNPHIKKIREKKLKPKPTTRQKVTALIGAVMTLFIIIGVITTVFAIVNATRNVVSQKDLKEELALAVFPFVIIDVPEFKSPDKLDNNAIISSAIWEFIIDKQDKSQYAKEELGSIFVPEVDIEHYIRKLYGKDIKIKHQTVEDPNVIMIYNPNDHMYNIDATPRVLPYKPRVDNVERKDNEYTLTVSYLLPDVMWSIDNNKKEPQIDKIMTYTLLKNDDGYEIKSVKFVKFGNTMSSQMNSSVNTTVSDSFNSQADGNLTS
ncbi:MAG: hypothetical protein RSA79_04435, partial [Oscillospiraceae bacterium]